MDKYLEFAKTLALSAGDIMTKYFDVTVQKREKQDKTIVTIADETINQMVIDEVSKRFPDHSVIGEEGSSKNNSKFAWVCDPIDGTVQYSKGIPVSVFSLALVKDGEPIVGVVYDPVMKRMYYATKGGGAFLNDTPMKVNDNALERHTVIDVEWWSDAEYDIATICHKLSVDTKVYILAVGSIVNAACFVASGQYGACIFAGSKGKNMDIAAAKVIVEEAGGKVTDLFGDEQRYEGDLKGAIVSNGKIHQELVKIIGSKL